jgi:hypothetical protein
MPVQLRRDWSCQLSEGESRVQPRFERFWIRRNVTRHKPRAPQLPEVVSEPDLSGPTALSFSEQRAVSSSVCFPLSKQKGLDNQNNESKLRRNISVLPINASAASFSRFFLWARSLFCCCRADILDLPWLGVPTSASFGAPGFGGRNSISAILDSFRKQHGGGACQRVAIGGERTIKAFPYLVPHLLFLFLHFASVRFVAVYCRKTVARR